MPSTTLSTLKPTRTPAVTGGRLALAEDTATGGLSMGGEAGSGGLSEA